MSSGDANFSSSCFCLISFSLASLSCSNCKSLPFRIAILPVLSFNCSFSSLIFPSFLSKASCPAPLKWNQLES
ncbi:hypothetical protein ['Prunus avium' virescence phytoplasma]|uniref:hypothetical protein n=1 Tax='Prunus avium' virescence phytoplasma TaxID=2056121 RepID=UPI003D800C06